MNSMETKKNRKGTLIVRENGLHLRPVAPEESGKGLPYAPENWPMHGDVWGWRVGRRITITGYYHDRYLYLPKRLLQHGNLSFKRPRLASKLAVERHIRMMFPDADIDAFFASFSWKIPAKQSSVNGERATSERQADGASCKAGNKLCNNHLLKADGQPYIPCDVCCSEPHFCRDCCCILCSKTMSSKFEGYSYIKCQASFGDGYICGHVAHVECALRAYMGGTAGGSIGMAAEYYCRLCDERTNLIPHVKRLIESCKYIRYPDEIEKILNIGVCILRGSEKADAKRLLSLIEFAIEKLKCGTVPEDIWRVDEDIQAISSGVPLSPYEDAVKDVANNEHVDEKTGCQRMSCVISDSESKSIKLKDEINQVLEELQKSQEREYEIAVECLQKQKKYIQKLYEKLGKKRSEMAGYQANMSMDAAPSSVKNKMAWIDCEVRKLEEMKTVANGFGRASKAILKEHFDL